MERAQRQRLLLHLQLRPFPRRPLQPSRPLRPALRYRQQWWEYSHAIWKTFQESQTSPEVPVSSLQTRAIRLQPGTQLPVLPRHSAVPPGSRTRSRILSFQLRRQSKRQLRRALHAQRQPSPSRAERVRLHSELRGPVLSADDGFSVQERCIGRRQNNVAWSLGDRRSLSYHQERSLRLSPGIGIRRASTAPPPNSRPPCTSTLSIRWSGSTLLAVEGQHLRSVTSCKFGGVSHGGDGGSRELGQLLIQLWICMEIQPGRCLLAGT